MRSHTLADMAVGAFVLIAGGGCAHLGPARGPAGSVEPMLVFNEPSEEQLAWISHPALREELLAMAEEDQIARHATMQATSGEQTLRVDDMAQVDRRNTGRMKEIVEEHGWPTRSMVGDDGAQAAWLLVQHADHDVDWQRKCLALMTPLLDEDEVFRGNVAYLTDRVLVNEDKLQLYATQFHTRDGKLVPRPMEEPANVDQRRKSMGLSTLEEYKELMRT